MVFGLKIWKVQGVSMAPVIPPGSFILATRWLSLLPIKEGHRLVIDHPKFGIIVKTVATIDKSGFIWSKGENEKSVPIEQLGPVNKHQILGRVISIFKPE